MPISTVGTILDSQGDPVLDRTIALQSFGPQGWTTLRTIENGRIDVEILDTGPGRGRSEPVPLRLLDESTGTPLVVSSDPLWGTVRNRLTADFGTIRLREEPVDREGVVVGGERVIGIPLGGPILDDQPGTVPGVPRLREQLEARTLELESRTLELETTTVELQKVQLDLSSALSRVGELTEALGTETPVVSVIAGLGTQLSETNTRLAAQPTPFRLAGVTLDLRGRFGNDGSTIVMDGASDGSGISADLVVDAPAPAVPTQAVPSVQGLTASAAARVLRSVGFAMDSATQQLGPDQGAPGQSVTQHPAPGAVAEFGTTVLVIFGVRNESDE